MCPGALLPATPSGLPVAAGAAGGAGAVCCHWWQ
jgi:hypothetical protein